MRLYPKTLKSLEELKREKQVLKYAKKHTGGDDFFEMKKGKAEVVDKQSDILSLIGDIATSKSFADIALTVGLPMLKLIGRKTEKNFIKGFAGEVVGGYLKWKVLQMGIRGVRMFMKMQKTKAEQEKAKKRDEKRRYQPQH